MVTKICRTCNLKKELSNSNFYYRLKDGWSNECRECAIKKHKEYNLKNKNKINQKNREHYKIPEIREAKLEYGRKYKKEHREEKLIKDKMYRSSPKRKEARAKLEKSRKQKDKVYHLKCYVRNMIGFCLKYKNPKRCKKTEQITKLEISQLKEYLLKSYKDRYGIEWDGKEKVEIDHIKPLILATTEKEVYELCYYTNLQLLKSKDNIEKGIKYEMDVK